MIAAFLVVAIMLLVPPLICPPDTSSAFYQYLSFAAAAILADITYSYARHTRSLARDTQRSVRGDMLLRLNELYAKTEIVEAIDFMHDFKREQTALTPEAEQNRYVLGEAFHKRYRRPDRSPTSLQPDTRREAPSNDTGWNVCQLRWHLTNFWYTVAMLCKEGIIDDGLVQRRFGSSLEVIDILERIEAVLSYHLGAGAERQELFSDSWPVWSLYAAYHGDPEADRENHCKQWAEFKRMHPITARQGADNTG